MRRTSDMVMPTPELANLASRLLHELRPGIDKYALLDRATGESYDLPDEVSRLLREACAEIAQNRAVCLGFTELELTTNQTADVLNVSRTFVLTLIERGELSCRLVGTHRRVRLDDALRYRDQMQMIAEAGIAEIAKLDGELGIGD